MKKLVSIIIAVLILSFSSLSNLCMAQENKDNPIVLIKTNAGDIYVELYENSAPKTVENFIALAEGTKEFTNPLTNKKEKRPFYDNTIFHRVIKAFMIQGGCPLGNGTGGPGYNFEDEINAKDLGLDTMKAIDKSGRPHPHLGIRSKEQLDADIVHPLIKSMGIKTEKEMMDRMEEVDKRMKEMTIEQALAYRGYNYSSNLKSYPPQRGVIAMANSGPNTNGSQFFINLVDTPWLRGCHTVFGKVVKGMDIVDKIGRVKVGGMSKPLEDVRIISIRKTFEIPQ